LPDRSNGGAADLANPLRDRVGGTEDLVGLLVQHQMVVAEVRTGDVPVEILGLDIEREKVGQQRRERAREVPDRIGIQVRRRGERGLAVRFCGCCGHDVYSTENSGGGANPRRRYGVDRGRRQANHRVDSGPRGIFTALHGQATEALD
jgi:hypothetical protein